MASPLPRVSLRAPADSIASWRACADAAGVSLNRWIVGALDRAAGADDKRPVPERPATDFDWGEPGGMPRPDKQLVTPGGKRSYAADPR